MYAGMTRNEAVGLLALVVLIGTGLGVRSCVRERDGAGVWIEQLSSSESKNHSGRTGFTPGFSSEGKKPFSSFSSEDSRLDLNAAGELELAERLPGIGEVKARAIVSYREEHGGFRDVRELLKVPGIGAKTLEKIAPLVYVKASEHSAPAPLASPVVPLTSSTAPLISATLPAAFQAAPVPVLSPADGRININTASSEELQTLVQIGPVRAEAILAYRKQHGPFQRIEDLEKVSGIGPKTVEKNRARIRVR